MGTKGYFGFYFKGRLYIVFHQCDSFPRHLGNDLLNELKEMMKEKKLKEWKDKFEELQILYLDHDEDFDKLTTEDHSFLIQHFHNDFFEKIQYPFTKDHSLFTFDNLYWLYLYNSSFTKILDSGFILIHSDVEKTIYDAEYGYVLDFDNCKFIIRDYHRHNELFFNLHELPKSLNFYDYLYES